MELTHLLQELQIEQGRAGEGSQNSDGLNFYPVDKVLYRICEHVTSPECSPEHWERILTHLGQLFRTSDAHCLFSDCCANAGRDLKKAYAELARSLTQYASLPLSDADGCVHPASSFKTVPSRARAVSTALLELVRRLGEGAETRSCHGPAAESGPSLVRTLSPHLYVFAATHLQRQPWTSEASREAASDLLSAVVHGNGCASVGEFLCGKTACDHDGDLRPILKILLPDLTKDRWNRNPATKHVFAWTLERVGRPRLADVLDQVFPPSLLMSDDYRTENQVLGVACLHHIIHHVPAADLRQYNRAQVIYHALHNHLYTPEAALIKAVLPCITDLLGVLEKPFAGPGLPRKRCCYDVVLQLVLTHMEMEHKLALRRAYAKSLAVFVEKMGIVVVRHLKRLERVFIGYLEISDSPEEQARLSILDALEKTLLVAWPRMESRVPALAQSLLRLLCDVSTEPLPPVVREALMEKATRCLLLLDYATQGKLRKHLEQIDSSCASSSVLECIRKVTQSPSEVQPTYQEHGKEKIEPH